jgi:D-tyrosyl-tRNA(Tyr) deacylase
MIALIQRVHAAKVTVEGCAVGEIGQGLLIFLGIVKEDGESQIDLLTDKIANFRIFGDEDGGFDRSLIDIKGSALVVSQFTLPATWRKGRRPGFDRAAPPGVAEPLYDRFVEKLRNAGIPTETGVFGAMMDVELINDGPVTFIFDTQNG